MPVSLEEVRKVLGSLAKEKSPGPAGWTVEFFLHFFELMGEDILRAEDPILSHMKILFALSFSNIDSGLKYLGFSLKANCYGTADWGWIFERIDRRINGWAAQWLSIGGGSL